MATTRGKKKTTAKGKAKSTTTKGKTKRGSNKTTKKASSTENTGIVEMVTSPVKELISGDTSSENNTGNTRSEWKDESRFSSTLPWVLGAAGLGILAAVAFAPKAIRRVKNQVVDATGLGNADADADTALGSDSSISPLFLRVRTELQRLVKQPELIDVDLTDDVATLRGPVGEDEVKGLVRALKKVPGISRVVNNLEPHKGEGQSQFHS